MVNAIQVWHQLIGIEFLPLRELHFVLVALSCGKGANNGIVDSCIGIAIRRAITISLFIQVLKVAMTELHSFNLNLFEYFLNTCYCC